MQSVLSDGSSARGFAGLASLGIPVDDLLADRPVPLPDTARGGLPHLDTGVDTNYLRSQPPRRKGLRWALPVALAVLVAVASAALFVWRANGTDAELVAESSMPVEINTSTLTRPPLGSDHVLTRDQIRYCLAEEIRLQAARDQVATQRVDIDRLNASVADLNTRCGSFKYQGDDLALAEADIAIRNAELVASGRAEFLLPVGNEETQGNTVGSGGEAQVASTDATASGESDSASASAAVSDPAQQRLIRDVQWLLFKLGFYNDVMSGVDTEATQAARTAYLSQRDADPSTSLEETLALLKIDTESPLPTTPTDNGTQTESSEQQAPAQDNAVEPAQSDAESVTVSTPVTTPDLSGLPDTDRLAIEQLCRATASDEGYAGCIDGQLSDLNAVPAPAIPLTQLSDDQRRFALAECGPVRGRDGPAAYYRCLAEHSRAPAVEVAVSSAVSQQLPQNVVSSIESRCAAAMNGESGEYARCVSGQFANLSDALNPMFLNAIEFSERASIEAVCASGPGVGDISAFYNCVAGELDALRQVGAKPDMKVASFEDRKNIETVCQQDRLNRGPADYYRCLDRELTARGY